MTSYDFKMHIPQRLENLLQAWDGGDLNGLNRVKETIIGLIDDNVFKTDLKDFDKSYIAELEKNEKNTMEGLKNVSNAKNMIDAEQTFIFLKQNYNENLNKIETEHWENIRNYIIGYIKEHYE